MNTGGFQPCLNQDFCNAFARTAACHRDAVWCSVPSTSLYCLLMAENPSLVQAAGPVWCHVFCPKWCQRSLWSLAHSSVHHSLSPWQPGNHTMVWAQSSPKDHLRPAPLSQAWIFSIRSGCSNSHPTQPRKSQNTNYNHFGDQEKKKIGLGKNKPTVSQRETIFRDNEMLRRFSGGTWCFLQSFPTWQLGISTYTNSLWGQSQCPPWHPSDQIGLQVPHRVQEEFRSLPCGTQRKQLCVAAVPEDPHQHSKARWGGDWKLLWASIHTILPLLCPPKKDSPTIHPSLSRSYLYPVVGGFTSFSEFPSDITQICHHRWSRR